MKDYGNRVFEQFNYDTCTIIIYFNKFSYRCIKRKIFQQFQFERNYKFFLTNKKFVALNFINLNATNDNERRACLNN